MDDGESLSDVMTDCTMKRLIRCDNCQEACVSLVPAASGSGIFCSGECKWSYSLSGPVLISPAKDLELRPQRAAHPTAAVPEGVPARGYAVAQRPEGGQF